MNLALLPSRAQATDGFQDSCLLPQSDELDDIPQTTGGEKLFCHTSAPGRKRAHRADCPLHLCLHGLIHWPLLIHGDWPEVYSRDNRMLVCWLQCLVTSTLLTHR